MGLGAYAKSAAAPDKFGEMVFEDRRINLVNHLSHVSVGHLAPILPWPSQYRKRGRLTAGFEERVKIRVSSSDELCRQRAGQALRGLWCVRFIIEGKSCLDLLDRCGLTCDLWCIHNDHKLRLAVLAIAFHLRACLFWLDGFWTCLR